MDWSVVVATIGIIEEILGKNMLDFLNVIVAAISSIGLLIVTFYRWVYCRHKEKASREKEEIYKPLHGNIETLINSVQNFEEQVCEKPLEFWKTLLGRVPFVLNEGIKNED